MFRLWIKSDEIGNMLNTKKKLNHFSQSNNFPKITAYEVFCFCSIEHLNYICQVDVVEATTRTDSAADMQGVNMVSHLVQCWTQWGCGLAGPYRRGHKLACKLSLKTNLWPWRGWTDFCFSQRKSWVIGTKFDKITSAPCAFVGQYGPLGWGRLIHTQGPS